MCDCSHNPFVHTPLITNAAGRGAAFPSRGDPAIDTSSFPSLQPLDFADSIPAPVITTSRLSVVQARTYRHAERLSYRVGKRVFDVTLCVLLAPLVASVCALIAVAARIDSPGPTFFRHRRIGLHGKSFGMWKFRTMCVDADAVLAKYFAAHPGLQQEWQMQHKLRDDPRVTRIGAFLRRTSLDELPQIWNVFRGTMSFVGPRPIVDAEVQKYGNHFKCFTEILPGITGLWQVSGRSTLSYTERIELDVRYAREWSCGLDMKILLRTLPCVLKSDGAF